MNRLRVEIPAEALQGAVEQALNDAVAARSSYVTVREAARYVRVTEWSIRHWIRLGRLPATKPGGQQFRILRSDLDKLLQDGAR
jgi:excisionase family DNA binding protein